MSDHLHKPELARALWTGAAAGLVASLAMDGFQAVVARFQSDDADSDDSAPATEQAAEKIAAAAGIALPKTERPKAGNAVHYAVGTLLGIGYAVAAEYEDRVTAGAGAAFGVTTAALLDETAVPLAGLSEAPWTFPAATHLYTLASHLVFGMTTEATRRLLRAA